VGPEEVLGLVLVQIHSTPLLIYDCVPWWGSAR